MTDSILVDSHDGWRQITLNRPNQLNSFNEEMHLAFRAALEAASDDADCRAVLITGAGRGFCAGQDLGDRDPAKMDGPPDLGKTVRSFWAPNVRLLRGMAKPVVCAVNGVAAGAGSSIALACDIVLAAKSAKFIQSFSKVGLIPDTGGSWHLREMLGEARAKALALTAHPLSAEDAAQWGLIWRAVPDEELMAEAEKLAAGFAAGPTAAYALTKEVIHAASTNSLDEQLDLERRMQRQAGMSDDYKEGVAAFLQKRPADYRKAKR